jgi:putative PEP-CTERM system histidine kinase
LATVNAAATVLGCLLVLRSIFRDGHFGLQVYPSQSVIQSSLTVLLAGVYFLIVGVLAKVVTFFGGDSTFALKTFLIFLSIVLLALLAQSDRINTGVRHFVSRHFSRPLYDYRDVWRKFNEGTATQLNQPDLCRSMAKVVADVCQALSVTIWLVDETKGVVTFSASTSQSEERVATLEQEPTLMASVIHHFQRHGDPVVFETVPDLWAETLRGWHPAEFPNGGSRLCVPIRRQGELVGLITVGDRVGGIAFGPQDYDLFRCIAEHAAASLLNLQLSQRLLQAKELESFQKMAAFFVHDLKNAASTLSLMLKNLPVHFDDPEFRQDALRGIGKTVARINELTGRLNTLRHELKLNLVETDVNEIVRTALAAVQLGSDVKVFEELTEVPRFRLDREQVGKVLLNLLLNAGEAMDGRGELRVSSGKNEGWAVVSVADTGCGMSADFLNRSLFRPFQTTKKMGLGIGMFQCKAIVEAHGGRITVTSEPGAGSVFQVFLPLANPPK